ncbi:MAG: hypothetical protein WBF33_25285 [Candidatus Nitrosopolaris sp.]
MSTNSPRRNISTTGGKDSAAVLLTAVERYNLHPLAVLVDNGFIPSEVEERSPRLLRCRHMQQRQPPSHATKTILNLDIPIRQ